MPPAPEFDLRSGPARGSIGVAWQAADADHPKGKWKLAAQGYPRHPPDCPAAGSVWSEGPGEGAFTRGKAPPHRSGFHCTDRPAGNSSTFRARSTKLSSRTPGAS